MSSLLAHRGESESIVETPYATLGVRYRATDATATRVVEERQAHTDHRHVVCVAGHLTRQTQASICSPRAGAAPGPLFEHRRILCA